VRPPPAHGLKQFVGVKNAESFREEAYSAMPAGVPVSIHRVLRVLDPATGKPVRFRRGVESDIQSNSEGGVGHLHRLHYSVMSHDESTIINALRGGIGYSKPHDVLYDDQLFFRPDMVFGTDKFHPRHGNARPEPLYRTDAKYRDRAALRSAQEQRHGSGSGSVSGSGTGSGGDGASAYSLPARPSSAAPVNAGKLAHASSASSASSGIHGVASSSSSSINSSSIGTGALASSCWPHMGQGHGQGQGHGHSGNERPSTAAAYMARTGALHGTLNGGNNTSASAMGVGGGRGGGGHGHGLGHTGTATGAAIGGSRPVRGVIGLQRAMTAQARSRSVGGSRQ
jgi:hypothetical protein